MAKNEPTGTMIFHRTQSRMYEDKKGEFVS